MLWDAAAEQLLCPSLSLACAGHGARGRQPVDATPCCDDRALQGFQCDPTYPCPQDPSMHLFRVVGPRDHILELLGPFAP